MHPKTCWGQRSHPIDSNLSDVVEPPEVFGAEPDFLSGGRVAGDRISRSTRLIKDLPAGKQGDLSFRFFHVARPIG
jgi:hypothetical protein